MARVNTRFWLAGEVCIIFRYCRWFTGTHKEVWAKSCTFETELPQNMNQHPYIFYWFISGVEGVCGVCAVDGWFTASLGLSQTDWTVAGWGMRAIMAPRINQPSTYTLEEEPQPWQLYHQLGEYHLPDLQINILYNIYPCPVSEGPKESLKWRLVRTNPATSGHGISGIIHWGAHVLKKSVLRGGKPLLSPCIIFRYMHTLEWIILYLFILHFQSKLVASSSSHWHIHSHSHWILIWILIHLAV